MDTNVNKEPQLVPLRIPSGWCVEFNAFFEIEPLVENGAFINASYFSEDMLSIERIVYEDSTWPHFVIDLGWYPAEEKTGQYGLILVSKNFNNVLMRFDSKELAEVTNTLERWLLLLSTCFDEDKVKSLLST